MNPAADNPIHLFHYFFSIYDAIGRVAVAVFPGGDSLIYLPVTHAIFAAGTLADHCIQSLSLACGLSFCPDIYHHSSP